MSYLGVIGSKAGAALALIELMSPEAFGACFIELFGGGLGVLLAKDPAKINIANELDPDLVLMHRAVQREADAVEAELRLLRDDDSLFEEAKRLRNSEEWDSIPEARRAALVIYVHKMSVNSNQQALSSSSKTNSSFNPNLALATYAKKLERVQIRHYHYAKCLDVYLYRSPEVEAFVFADPPYVIASKQLHYRFNFHPIEHIRFWHRMTRLSTHNSSKRNVKIMITYDDVPLIRALYRKQDGWRIQSLSIGYNSAHDTTKSRSEVVITNYDPPHSSSPSDSDTVVSDGVAVGATMDGVPFADLTCCDQETIMLVQQGKQRGKCHTCGKNVSVKARHG